MGYLLGLSEYLDRSYNVSIFDQACSSKQLYQLHLHNDIIINAEVTKNLKYDLNVKINGQADEFLPKINIKMIFSAKDSNAVKPLLKMDKKVKDLGLEPITSPRERYHIKNKTLFPLLKEREVVFFTLLEGEIIRGIITDFSRYEISVSLKGGLPITILRHSIYDLRDKKGRCFLKAFQEELKDWEKSRLFVSSPLNMSS